ncbi:hypothetical protein O181_009474 [Austropuccinia psidii MF-1]|uniref:Uncharacterized protein n=1 Tax=Austropuccinia psidii MF-1 TaxID=1389203 RepID=A0A9Q3BQW1_9BASI|nr:hypothetical protein [Austropuccinia psidii MF-1]
MCDQARHHANRLRPDSFKYAKERWEKSHTPPDFKVGDLVLVLTPSLNSLKGQNKSNVSYAGPLMIRELHGTNGVQLECTGELMNTHPALPPDLILWPIGHVIIFMANWPFHHFYGQLAISSFLWPIGHVINFMANWSILVFYGLWATPPFTGQLWPQTSHMASGNILLSLANYPPHQPPGQYPLFWAWAAVRGLRPAGRRHRRGLKWPKKAI